MREFDCKEIPNINFQMVSPFLFSRDFTLTIEYLLFYFWSTVFNSFQGHIYVVMIEYYTP